MKNSKDFEEKFKQDGFLWGFRKGSVIPEPIRRLWTDRVIAYLILIFIAIAVFIVISSGVIAWKVLKPTREPVLTTQYNSETMEQSRAFYGNHQPFFLSGITLLWCNGSLVSFPSDVTVVKFNATSLEQDGAQVTVCRDR